MIKEISKLTRIKETVLAEYQVADLVRNPRVVHGQVTANQEQSLAMLMDLVKELGRAKADNKELDSSVKTAEFFKARLGQEEYEHMEVAYLTSKHRIIKVIREHSGTINESTVYPRNIVKNALLLNANCVVLAHNHPAGSNKPSKPDIDVTEKIKQALKTVDIKLLDHIIVVQGSVLDYYSFAENEVL